MSNKAKVKFVCDCGKKYEVRKPSYLHERGIKCECGKILKLFLNYESDLVLERYHGGSTPYKREIIG